jgi:hypothetical protein
MKQEYILLNVDRSNFVYNFPPQTPLILNENAYVGLKNMFLWYTYPNISAKYNNNKIRYFDGQDWKTMEIPEGMYDIEELNKFFTSTFLKISLSADAATFKCLMTLTDSARVDFSVGELYKILGFEPRIYNETSVGAHIINITRGVDRILIRCNLVNRPFQTEYKDCLYDILPVGSPGSAIHQEIENVEFHKCLDATVRKIEIRITDMNNNLIDFAENMSLKLVFKF